MSANNEIGTIQPIEEIAKLAHAHNILFHTDAVQAIGSIHFDVKAMGIDMLSMSGINSILRRHRRAVHSQRRSAFSA